MRRAMAVYKGLNTTQETDLLAVKNTAIYKFPAMPSYFHIRQFINCGSDPAFSEPDSDVLTPLICEQCKIQVTHPNLL